MLFNSRQFAVFLPIVFILYWSISNQLRWGLLLVSSYYFYMCWKPEYLLLICIITFVTYISGILIERYDCIKSKRMVLISCVITCLGTLFYFKYFNFLIYTLNIIRGGINKSAEQINALDIILPVGISFYIFQTMSYVIDVYRQDIKAEKHIGYYAAFVSFFPQLVAGPIERSGNLLAQISGNHYFDYGRATYGLKLMAWGFFKKVVIADTLSKYVDIVYGNVFEYRGFAMLIAMIFFSIQIYCDFSGYSDIAIGTAKLFDIDLMTNFKSPYFSTSINEFWRRWHISLSTWFRDYVYIPLGGNRMGKNRKRLNLLITFGISGLWHGASFSFIIWGVIHGIYQVIETFIVFSKKQKNFWMKVFLTFGLVTIAWVFFRANGVSEAIFVLRNCLEGISNPIDYCVNGLQQLQLYSIELIKILFFVSILGVFDYYSLKTDVIACLGKCSNVIVRWSIYILFMMLIVCFGQYGESAYIYFQF